MLFLITSIEFDFDSDNDLSLTINEQQELITSVLSGDWDAEDEEDLVESITEETGWCIKAISYKPACN